MDKTTIICVFSMCLTGAIFEFFAVKDFLKYIDNRFDKLDEKLDQYKEK